MKPYRRLWIVTGAMVLAVLLYLAIETFLYRANVPKEAITPVPLSNSAPTPSAILDHMFDLLRVDPNAADADTRQAVDAAANLARTGELITAETLFAQGLRASGSRDLATAESAYRRAISESPKWSWPYAGLGIVLSQQERYSDAQRAFQKAIELDPQWSRPHNDLSILLRVQGKTLEADREARRAIELDPNNPAIYNNYGNLLVTMGDYQGAETSYQRSIALNPSRAAPHYNLACLFCIQGRTAEAIKELSEAIRLEPAFAETAREDQDLARLRETPEFSRLVGVEQNTVAEPALTTGTDAYYDTGPQGTVTTENSDSGGGAS